MHIISKDALDFKAQMTNLLKPQNIAIAGLFTALYVVLSYFNIKISNVLEIRWPFLVLAASGMFGGPVMGIVVAVLSDVVSTILGGYAFFPGFTISYALMACAFGFIYYRKKITIPRAIAGSVVEVIISLTLNTIWLSMMYGTPYTALFVTRLVKCCVMFFVNSALLYLFLNMFSRVLKSLNLTAMQRA